jgi:hypothetical protein
MIDFAFTKRQRKGGSILLSIVVHIFLIIGFASLTFRVPLSAFLRGSTVRSTPEQIHFVKVLPPAPRERVGNGSAAKAPARASAPAALRPPSAIPSTLPPVPAPTVSVGAISGREGGTGGAAAGLATGVEPALPDPRLELDVGRFSFPKSAAQQADSAVRAVFEAYREATIAAQLNPGRNPRDWTIDRNGQKYGLDSQYIYLGKFKIPSAILAALPINTGGVDGSRILNARSSDWIRQDILSHSQGLTEDDFRAAVKRIRERKERERRNADDQKKDKPVIATGTKGPVIP